MLTLLAMRKIMTSSDLCSFTSVIHLSISLKVLSEVTSYTIKATFESLEEGRNQLYEFIKKYYTIAVYNLSA